MMASANRDPRKGGTIWMIDLDEPAAAVVPGVKTTFCQVGIESLPQLAAAMNETAPEEIRQRLENGRQCYTAWVEGKLAAYGWVSFKDEMIGELRLRLRLLKGEVYIWDCVTLPAHRNKHLYSALLVYMFEQLRAKRLCRLWIGTDGDNLASQHGIARAGFHHIANLSMDRVLALRLFWVQGLPGIPETLVAEARRVFLDNRDNLWRGALYTVAGKPS